MSDAVIDPARAIPVLAWLSIAETQEFYIQTLGFAEIYKDDDYLIVRREQIEIHFWKTNNGELPENTSCYIRGGQIVSLFDEYQSRAVPRLSAFEAQPWNMKEFCIHDPHGNLLRFGATPEEI